MAMICEYALEGKKTVQIIENWLSQITNIEMSQKMRIQKLNKLVKSEAHILSSKNHENWISAMPSCSSFPRNDKANDLFDFNEN